MNIVIILAGGTGSRMKLGFNKVFAKIKNKPVLYYTIKNFEDCDSIKKIIVTAGNHENGTAQKDIKTVEKNIEKYKFKKIKKIVAGGETRMRSVQNGLKAADLKDNDIVLIQDGARPFTKLGLINKLIKTAQKYGSAICGVTPKDTIQLVDSKGFGIKTFNRDNLIAVQTPIAAKWNILKKAREKALKEKYLDTPGFEDSAILQQSEVKVKIVESDYDNIKITTKEDLEMAKNILINSK